MRKLFTFFAALLCATTAWADVAVNGKLPGAFTINSDGDQVYFSQGNLLATTTDLGSSWTWSFAENQWDYIGNAAANTAINGNGTVSTNGTVDLFGWSTDATYYGIHNSKNNDYSGDFVDWGSNAITNGGNTANAWRTLTKDELVYLFNTRSTASGIRYAKATINDIAGVIILPDDWSTSYYTLLKTNTVNAAFADNEITSTDWTNSLEANGAVFLPAAGYRLETDVKEVDIEGDYWSATPRNEDGAYYYFFYSSSFYPHGFSIRWSGFSVRLVSDEAPVTPATVTAAPTAKSLTYNGSAQALVNAGTASGGTMNYSLDNSTWSTSIPTATDADDYTVYYKVVGDASHTDYIPSPNTVAVTIAKAALTIQADDSNLEYGDPAWWCKKATYTGFVNGEDVTVLSGAVQFDCEYTDGGNVGTYSITPYGVTADNYEITFVPGTVTVNKAASSVTAAPTAIDNLVYTGAAQTLVNAGTAAGGTMWYSVDGGAYSTDLPQATAIGNHTVYYKVVGDANHNDVTEASLTATIYMQITARPMAGADMLFNVLPDYTVNALKLLIAAEMGCPAEQLRLVFAGKQLEDGRTLGGDYNIQHQCVIMVIRRVSEDFTANEDPDKPGTYYSTYYNNEWKFMLPEGVEAYIATVSGETLLLTKIAEEGEVIPADNAVILKANVSDFTLSSSYADPVSFEAVNSLLGVDEATAAPANCYVLSGHSSDNSVTGVGFYQFTGTLKAHKAYAVIDAGIAYSPKKLRFVFNQEQTTTDVENSQFTIHNSQCTKVIRDGQLIIIRGDKEYNANGQIVK